MTFKLKKNAIAAIAIQPSVNSAALIQDFSRDFGEVDLNAVIGELDRSVSLLKSGDCSQIEAILLSQAFALQSIFTGVAHRASTQKHLQHWESMIRVALKAQSQCRATLESLAMLKNPAPRVIAKQANFTTGPQQVNNGLTQDGNRPAPSKLLEPQNGRWVDPRTTCTTGGRNQILETVGAL